MSETGEFFTCIFRIDGNEEFLSGFRLRSGHTTRTGLVRAVAGRRPRKKGCEKGWCAVDQIVIRGEQSDGTYKVFVEIQRDDGVGEQIMELAGGIENLTGMGDIKFRYYKEFRSKPLTLEELNGAVPTDPNLYGVDSDILNDLSESMNNYTNFFNKSMVENVNMWGDMLTIKKIWADPVAFKFVDFGPTQTTLDNITESFNINDFSEIIFLSKYVGDYNITKYGNKLTFENNGQTLVLERIIL